MKSYTVYRKRYRNGNMGDIKAIPSMYANIDVLKRKGFVVRQADAERMSQAISKVKLSEGWV